jgi:hypothetical protein
MNTKFTEGKWVANASEFPFPHGLVYIENGGFDVSGAPDCVANAHLIAAAPDMYAMLEMLVNGDSINDHSIEKEVISLLTKARGELK